MQVKSYNRLKIVLQTRGITYLMMAKKLNVSESTIIEWCNNQRQPSLKSLYKIKDVLNVSICQLLV